MARRQREEDDKQDLDLSPFMNMVIILIPLLLMSVVFLEVAVINVTMPLGGSSTPSEDAEEKLDLAIAMSPSGFYVTGSGAQLPPIPGCPAQGPTICLKDESVDVQNRFEEARRLMASGEEVQGEAVLEEGLQAYNYRELYNLLASLKNRFPDESTVRIAGDRDTPFALTVRVMDVSRYQLEEDSYDSEDDFWRADFRTETAEDGEEQYANLFGDPAFAVVQ